MLYICTFSLLFAWFCLSGSNSKMVYQYLVYVSLQNTSGTNLRLFPACFMLPVIPGPTKCCKTHASILLESFVKMCRDEYTIEWFPQYEWSHSTETHGVHWNLHIRNSHTGRCWSRRNFHLHDDVIKWKHFPRYWPSVRGIHRSPHKGQWRRDLMFSFICARMNGWVSNRETGDLRCCRAHYDVIVMYHIFPKSGDRIKKHTRPVTW